jgi:hypothetical protein
VRLDLTLTKLAHGGAQYLVLFGKFEIHGGN